MNGLSSPLCEITDEYGIELTFGSRDLDFACHTIPKVEVDDRTVLKYVTENYSEAKSFLESAILLADHYENQELISSLSKMAGLPEKITQWTRDRRKQIGADWESE